MSRSLHLVTPRPQDDADPAGRMVVKSFAHGPDQIDLAIDLWRVAGDEKRASQLQAVIDRGYARDSLELETGEISDALRLLDGLEEALQRSTVDAEWRIRPERMADVRARSKTLDLHESRGEAAVYAVDEAVSRVAALTVFMKEALDSGLHVALD